jgi:2-keto-4-pentenoate hydratase/2-oxohepta-3-ene-1,7-dioic acid hydratase in catechol pathway
MNRSQIGTSLITLISTSLLSIGMFYLYLDRPLAEEILPANFQCLQSDQGRFAPQAIQVNDIFGIGLTYAKHINETASDFDSKISPPVFRKSRSSLTSNNSRVAIPTQAELLTSSNKIEPEIETKLEQKGIRLSPLIDYEAELAFVLLEDISAQDLTRSDFIPKIGFLVANDLSARSIAILGDGQKNRYDYWGASKGFSGFTPISNQVWIPKIQVSNGIPCIQLQTHVDGMIRQNENTNNLIYTPKDMLKFIQKRYPTSSLQKGDLILTGTPGGVILNVPRWKVRLAAIIGMDRFQKLSISQSKSNIDKFLKAGNDVRISAEWLGTINTTITN